MDAEEMYEKVCKPWQIQMAKSQDEIKTIALSTHKAICESNGKPSILSRLDMLEREDNAKTKFGVKFQPIESRDIPRVIIALGVVVLILERFGVLKPLMELLAK